VCFHSDDLSGKPIEYPLIPVRDTTLVETTLLRSPSLDSMDIPITVSLIVSLLFCTRLRNYLLVA
jgi:hypothetical protein